ncbi:dihydroorotate dehydrogenase [Clostridium polyendosporum]|uniref:Dihydroorotate dehydrogenase n=1 Tax=Clostridium polyendosporum TaxID=69208 RepID=A0A919RY07_9CLOT|nr:DUF2325 domain-containing protein [Clostridium polyendosporum]GIM27628.1 dihydroorotate dehydrogenase [Clostridium polyendosporum]
MCITIVGGDNIAKINGNLYKNGFFVIKHISGRKKSHKCVEIPKNTDIVLVFIDYVNHKLCEHIKRESKKMGIKAVYSKRAWSYIETLLCE